MKYNTHDISELSDVTHMVDTTADDNVLVFVYRMADVPQASRFLMGISREYAFQKVDGILSITFVYNGVLCIVMGSHTSDSTIDKIVEFYGEGKALPSMRNLIEYNHRMKVDESMLQYVDGKIRISRDAADDLFKQLEIHYRRISELEEERKSILANDGRTIDDFDDDFTSPLNIIDNYAIWDTPPTSNYLRPCDNYTDVDDTQQLYLLAKAEMLDVDINEVEDANIDYYEDELVEFQTEGIEFNTPRLLSIIDMTDSSSSGVNWITHNRGVESSPLPHMIYEGMDGNYHTRACLGNQVDTFAEAISDFNIGSLKAASTAFITSVNMNDSVGEDFVYYTNGAIPSEEAVTESGMVELRVVDQEQDNIPDVISNGDPLELDDQRREMWDSFYEDDSE